MNKLLVIELAVMAVINLVFFALFERTRPKPKDVLPMVVICCGASLGRVVFAPVPQVQPVTMLVMVYGGVYGCRKGYVAGALCALTSNLILGQGPWTLFQMTGWGTIGLLSGLLGKGLCRAGAGTRRAVFTAAGFPAAMLFSLITDLLTVSYLGEALTLPGALGIFATGMAFNVGHGVFNCILLAFLYELLTRKLERVKVKA